MNLYSQRIECVWATHYVRHSMIKYHLLIHSSIWCYLFIIQNNIWICTWICMCFVWNITVDRNQYWQLALNKDESTTPLLHTSQGCPAYFREGHWKGMGLPEIFMVTWQVCYYYWCCIYYYTGITTTIVTFVAKWLFWLVISIDVWKVFTFNLNTRRYKTFT